MIIRKGDIGDNVKALQLKLGLVTDGIFGNSVEAAVKVFQSKNGLVADGIVGNKTWNAILTIGIPQSNYKYSKDKIESVIKSKGYKWFEDKLNIVGVRNSDTGEIVTNVFDDKITVSKNDNGIWKYYEWTITTDPGRKGVMEFGNPAGVARLVPGQYIESHALGMHKGQYQALRQQKPVKVYRDSNRNLTYEEHTIDEGLFGINIHKAGVDSTLVENWSEGCQVFKRAGEFEAFMELCRNSGQRAFTYTLIESKDII